MPLTLIISQPGAYTIDDDGILGNNTSVIRDADGVVIFTLVHPADALTITTSVPGVNLTINILDSLGAADVTIGDLANAAASPDSVAIRHLRTGGDVVLAATGAITEAGSDTAPDITAATLVLSAGTGVGAGNAIETRTGGLEAETTTGGIALANQGAVVIGGLTASVDGLDVATSGDLTLTATGGITLNDDTSLESVHGGSTSGNVTLTALGANSDVTSMIDQDAISAAGGSIIINAGRDIAFGTAGLDFDNDVRARGSVTLNAGRDITVDGFADVASDDFGGNTGGALTATAGRNITVGNTTGNDGSLAASGTAGADVILTTGAGGILTVTAATSNAVSSASGDIVARADAMIIGATSGMTTGVGRSITLRSATSGLGIDLGSAVDPAGVLALSDAELDRMTTGHLIIGDSVTDTITVSSAVSRATGAMTVNSGADLLANANLSTGGNLVLNAADNLLIAGAAAVTGASVLVAIDAPSSDPGVGGILTLSGSLVGPHNVFGNADADTMVGNADANTFNGAGGADLLRGLGGADILRGGDGADTLEGGTGADRLEGGTGSDQMSGGADNDLYIVTDAGDVTTELVGEGIDTVETNRPSWTLSANVENLTYTGASAFVGSGNALGNTIRGGTAGDTLIGGDGNDILMGGAGAANNVFGGLGNDYFILQVADTVIESAGQGADTVEARLNAYVLGANIENLIFGGVGNFNGTGNAGNNLIIGGAGDDTLRGGGGGGSDQLRGGLGTDTVQLAGLPGEYTIAPEGAGFRITDTVGGRDGTILLTDMEVIRYNNGVTEPVAAPVPVDKGSAPLVLPALDGDEFLLKDGDMEPLVLPDAGDSPALPDTGGAMFRTDPTGFARAGYMSTVDPDVGFAPADRHAGQEDWLM
ncbi:calcium-binding protein [Brevundimonas sp.]|uniref:beta strand repeat-containing protein n=1 Tax=Brevundimonas sp. TaxID=1871086 RepID=UPI002D46709C|nr:calcium-binding protein [Brevundimonas sp.]HYC96796.1 calcium-binding protein [Brevundimonas sp.]